MGSLIHRYDLRSKPLSYDFIQWLSIVMAKGCDLVNLDKRRGFATKGYSEAESEGRLKDIVLGSLEYFGVPWKYGGSEGDSSTGHHIGACILNAQAGNYKPLPVKPPKRKGDYCTFTIRRMRRQKNRNTCDHFLSFAQETKGAVVVPDYSDKRIDFKDRMALYAGARCNFFTSNGPMMLCMLSELPYRIFGLIATDSASPFFMKTQGIEPGWQPSWRVENQAIVWEPITFGNIQRVYDQIP